VAAFRDRDTAHFHQFAVDPALQRRGLGRRLVAACERWARERGYKRMALDVAEPAAELRALYAPPGLRADVAGAMGGQVLPQRGDGKGARPFAAARTPATLARYNLWATRELLRPCRRAARGRLPARRWACSSSSIHGTLNHLLLGEHELWYRRFAEGSSPAIALDAESSPTAARCASAWSKARWPGCR
jgi:hypothetical protein